MNDTVNVASVDRLRGFVERIERVEEEMDNSKADRKEIYLELKGEGYDAKAIRKVVRLRKQDRATRQEEEALLDTYKSALGID
jgi:uncharacterized protein (UPF0335 family)